MANINIDIEEYLDEVDTTYLVEELNRRGMKVIPQITINKGETDCRRYKQKKEEIKYCIETIRNYFESSNSNAKEVLQELLMIGHQTTTITILNELRNRLEL